MRIPIFLFMLVAALSADFAVAQSLPDSRPFLRIEPGMHSGRLWRTDVDANCSLMVTGSDDKTARLWALPEGGAGQPSLIRVLRPPIGDGNLGKVFAVAISPDGKWIAVGGWDARYGTEKQMSVYIFEAASGRLVRRLGNTTDVYRHLVFSADGTRLAAVTGSVGMRLWEVGSWRQIAEDTQYGNDNSYGAAFDAANRLFTIAYDGYIRRYSADGRLEAKGKAAGGSQPFGIAVHPSGTKVAIGYQDTVTVDVYDASTLRRLYAANTSSLKADRNSNLAAVTWSPSGDRLYAGGRYNEDGIEPLLMWPNQGRGPMSKTPLSENTVMALSPCRGNLQAGSADPAFGMATLEGKKLFWQIGVTPEARGKVGDAFTASPDGKSVRFGLGFGAEDPVVFDLANFKLSDAPSVPVGFSQPKVSGLNITNWEHTVEPRLNGKNIELQNYEISRSLAIAPDNSRFVLGTEWALRAFKPDGSKIWAKDVPGVTYGVNIARNGRVLIAAHRDGTIRWYRLSDGQELLALFVHKDDHRYVAWTPKGYYAASPGAEELIGWHVNRDWDHAADFFPASRFRSKYYRPDIVKRVLDDLDEDVAVAEANRIGGTNRQAPEDIKKRLPPVITILSPDEGGSFASDSLVVRYSVRSPSDLPVNEVTALIDSRPIGVDGGKGLGRVSVNSETEGTITLHGLPQRDVTLSLLARSGDLDSTPVSIHLKYKGKSAPSIEASRGVSLYAVIVGVSKFQEKAITPLRWAAKDARDMAAMLQAQEGGLYRKVEVKLLTDDEATHSNILRALTWLQRSVGSGDVGVVYLSGHGMTEPSGDYYYVSHDSELEQVAGLSIPTRDSAIPDSEISRTLRQLAGNAIFLFDTCHAGKASGTSFRGENDTNKFVNEIATSANAIVFSSSTGSELSLERDEWQNGAFTKALLEGLSGQADYNKDGYVSIDELTLYVKDRVKSLTGGLQHPVDLRPRETREISIAKIK